MERLGSIGQEAFDRIECASISTTIRIGYGASASIVSSDIPWADCVRPPPSQVSGDGAHGSEGRDDVGQLDGDVVRRDELPDCERRAGQQRDRPCFAQAAATVDDVDETSGTSTAQEWKLAPDHRAQVALADPGHAQSVMIGVATAPKAAGAVLPIRATPAAFSGSKPRPISIPTVIARARRSPRAPPAGRRTRTRSSALGCVGRRKPRRPRGAACRSVRWRWSSSDPHRVHHDPHDRKDPDAAPAAALFDRLPAGIP